MPRGSFGFENFGDRFQHGRAGADAFPVEDADVAAARVGERVGESLVRGGGVLGSLQQPFGRGPIGRGGAG